MNDQTFRKHFANLEGVVFDCDGVLIESRAANLAMYGALRHALGLPPLTAQQQEYVHMSTFKQALALIAPGEHRLRLEALLAPVSASMDYESLLQEQPCAVQFMHFLRQTGKRMAVFTNRVGSLESLLQRFGLYGFFDAVYTADIVPPKPDPEGLIRIMRDWGVPPTRVAFVGDSRMDAEAAGAAGVAFWAMGNAALPAVRHCSGFADLLACLDAPGAA